MPDWKQLVRSRLSNTQLEPASETDIVDELAQHLDDRYQALRSEGANEKEAYAIVVDEFGESELLLQELRPRFLPTRFLPAFGV